MPKASDATGNDINGTAAAADPAFFERIHTLSAEEWQAGMKVYVYRLWPVIDRRDNEHFLCKIGEPFDEDYLLRHFGSGKYFLRLNDGRGKTVSSKAVSLHNPAFPPKVSPDEVIESDPRNEQYFKVWGKAKPQAEPSASPSAVVEDQDSPATAAVHRLADLAQQALRTQNSPTELPRDSTLDQAVVALWSETAKHRDALAEKVAQLSNAAPVQSDPIQMLDRVLAVVEKMQRASDSHTRPEPQKSSLDQVRELAEIAALLRDSFGAADNHRSRREDAGVLETILAHASPVFTQLAAPIGHAIAARMTSAGAGKPAGVPAAPQPSMSPTTFAPPTPQQTVPPAVTLPETQANAAGPEGAFQPGIVHQAVAELAPYLMNALNTGSDGYGFAEAIATLHGQLVYEQIAAMGVDALMTALKAHEQMWAQLAPVEGRVRQFITEFVDWGNGDDGSDQEHEEEEDEGAAKKPHSKPAPGANQKIA